MQDKPKPSPEGWYWQGALTIAIFLLGLIPATSLACASISIGPVGYIILVGLLILVQLYLLIVADATGLRRYGRLYPWLVFAATLFATLAFAGLYALPMLQQLARLTTK